MNGVKVDFENRINLRIELITDWMRKKCNDVNDKFSVMPVSENNPITITPSLR